MWAILALSSAVLLGLYDVCRKHALRGNAVLPLLFLATLSGTCVTSAVLLIGTFSPETLAVFGGEIHPLTPTEHGLVALKAFIVASSWVLGYFALKHLPISIAGPIRASSPLWTLLGALIIFHERPTAWQWGGLAVVLVSYYAFSIIGAREGIRFFRNPWIYCIALDTVISSVSALYDKYLVQIRHLPPLTMLVWFSLYLAVILGLVVAVCWWPVRRKCTPLTWRWSIPCIGVLLVISDLFYYSSLCSAGALIALVSAIRRSNVVVSFSIGSILFREENTGHKMLALAGVLLGVFIIVLARH